MYVFMFWPLYSVHSVWLNIGFSSNEGTRQLWVSSHSPLPPTHVKCLKVDP